MGIIAVALVDEDGDHLGKAVPDTRNVIARVLPDMTDTSYCCLRFIDLYGDTVFNTLQVDTLLAEWDRIRPSLAEREALDLWEAVRKVIELCREGCHLYVKFIGD